jgi:hypothetical protein
MLVITGTQRSGTTLIAQALHQSGYDLGTDWYDEEAQGGFDNDLICGFYQQYLGDPTFPFDDYEWPVVEPGQFAAMGYEVVKFCYLLMNPAFVSIWHKFRSKRDTFLVMDRRAENVVASKLRRWNRFKHDSLLLQQWTDELEFSYAKSLRSLKIFKYQIKVLEFPACVEHLDEINAALAALDPNVQIKPEAWERVFDPSKIHFK